MVSQLRYLGNPVLSLQTMLRAISFHHPVIPRLIPSGVFDESTLEAVMTSDPNTWAVTSAALLLYNRFGRWLEPPRPAP